MKVAIVLLLILNLIATLFVGYVQLTWNHYFENISCDTYNKVGGVCVMGEK